MPNRSLTVALEVRGLVIPGGKIVVGGDTFVVSGETFLALASQVSSGVLIDNGTSSSPPTYETIGTGSGIQPIPDTSPEFYAAATFAPVSITGVPGSNVLASPDWSFGGVEQAWAREATTDDASAYGVSAGQIIIVEPGFYRVNINVPFSSPPDRMMTATVTMGGFVRDETAVRGAGGNLNYYLFNLDQWVLSDTPKPLLTTLRWPSFTTTTSVDSGAVELELFKMASL